MENLSSDEEFDVLSERFGSYSLSADVSECESSSSCSYQQFDREGVASTSVSSPPLDERDFSSNTLLPTPLTVTLPVYGSRHVKMPPPPMMERPDTEMSGKFCTVLVDFLDYIVDILMEFRKLLFTLSFKSILFGSCFWF